MTPNTNQPLLPLDGEQSETGKPNKSAPREWFFLTNQMNLMMDLAAGLFMSPQGFGDKYYGDLLARFPGWVPLFPGKMPRNLVEEVRTETKHLMPVVAGLDVKTLHGEGKTLTTQGRIRDIAVPSEVDADDKVLFVLAAQPISTIRTIYFHTRGEKTDFVSRAKAGYANIPTTQFSMKVKKGIFEGRRSDELDRITLPDLAEFPFDLAQAAGGVQAMMFHFANRSQTACRYYQWAYQDNGSSDGSEFDLILQQLPTWSRGQQIDDRTGPHVKLFWDIVNGLVMQRDPVTSFYDVVIGTLDEARNAMSDENRRQVLATLSNDLHDLRGMSDQTVTSLFERHTKPFSRSLLLAFLRNDCRGLLDFDDVQLTQTDYLTAAILFGARQRWIGLPLELRLGSEFSDLVNDCMAGLILQQLSGAFEYLQPTRHFDPLFKLLTMQDTGSKAMKVRTEAKLRIARHMKWNCIRTTVSFGIGDYPLKISRSGVQLSFPGEPTSVQVEIDPEVFFQSLATNELPMDLDLEIREMISSSKSKRSSASNEAID